MDYLKSNIDHCISFVLSLNALSSKGREGRFICLLNNLINKQSFHYNE